jgi:eukaryotic-like serine/threonine-protein kinase
VPGLTGHTQAQAIAVLKKGGLKPVVHQVWADGYDAGIVSRQRPKAGVKVDDSSAVDLWVSRGPLHIASPDLTGMQSAAATALLEREYLVAHKRRTATRNVPKGQIYRQDPAPGAIVARGDTLTFWVSSGPPVVTVPDVVGLSSGAATAALKDKGLVAHTDLVAGWGRFPGDVVEQDPAAGTRLRKGDEVVIKVAVF